MVREENGEVYMTVGPVTILTLSVKHAVNEASLGCMLA